MKFPFPPCDSTAFQPNDPAMTPFLQARPNVLLGMMRRQRLLEKPLEAFAPHFGGRVPTLSEKLIHVEQLVQGMIPLQVYHNNLYDVQVFSKPPFLHLYINRHDEQPCDNWRHFQQIKNEIVGAEYEAIELFPAQSRLVDCANEYHLWVHTSPTYRFPVSLESRGVPPHLAELARQVHASETSTDSDQPGRRVA